MLPVMLDIRGKKCTVIGGGKVALRKAKKLIKYGGDVLVISAEFCKDFGKINTIKKQYEQSDISGSFLVIAATDNHELNRKIAQNAKTQNILVSLADDAEISDFIFPASDVCGDITFSASTNGRFPILARKLCREKGADMEFYNSILPLLEKYRQKIIAQYGDTKKELMEYMLSDEMLAIARSDISLFEQKIKEKL